MTDSDDQVVAALRFSIDNRDPEAFDAALKRAIQRKLTGAVVDLLVDVLVMPWHTRHEDVALALQDLRDPRAVEALYTAALTRYEYLAYDDGFALARKCTWALADIGTEQARARLEALARSDNPTIAAYAQRRLDRWGTEHSVGAARR